MIIKGKNISSFDFDGIEICDFTSEMHNSASVASITVHSDVSHTKARSVKSDKYYYCISGVLHFSVADKSMILEPGDLIIVEKKTWFSYINKSNAPAQLLLFHVPEFELEFEEFE